MVAELRQLALIGLMGIQVLWPIRSAADMNPEQMMAPSEVNGPGETLLSDQERRDLVCQVVQRHALAQDFGADVSTETVSQSDQFGHVFRYKKWNGEGAEQRDDGTLVLWTRDCDQFRIATYPAPFSLPK